MISIVPPTHFFYIEHWENIWMSVSNAWKKTATLTLPYSTLHNTQAPPKRTNPFISPWRPLSWPPFHQSLFPYADLLFIPLLHPPRPLNQSHRPCSPVWWHVPPKRCTTSTWSSMSTCKWESSNELVTSSKSCTIQSILTGTHWSIANIGDNPACAFQIHREWFKTCRKSRNVETSKKNKFKFFFAIICLWVRVSQRKGREAAGLGEEDCGERGNKFPTLFSWDWGCVSLLLQH